MDKRTIGDIDVAGKRVLVRVDFNVPMDETAGVIADDTRIRATVPTLSYLTDRGARVIIASHLGRPKGKIVESLRLAGIGRRLSEIMDKPVTTLDDCIGPGAEQAASELKNGDILQLENVRFHTGEEENDAAFAQALAALADVYVNDAFGVSHRAHASVAGITRYLPSVAGLLLEKELVNLGRLLENPAHPFAALTGGAKVSDKMGLLENTIDKVDFILVGGGMAATFLKAKSCEIGLSSFEPDMLDLTATLVEDSVDGDVELLLPVDVVVADDISAGAAARTVTVENIPPQSKIVDIGPQTAVNFTEVLKKCRTVFWNGPMGVYEIPQFSRGTRSMVELLASLGAATVLGGGSTAEAVTGMGLADKMTFISTGGGASLEFLGGLTLPGVAALPDKELLTW
ncbi:phosphoglycerate kinase [Chloroflexota bacterium]